MQIERFISKLFGPPEEIYLTTGFSSHLERWIIVDRRHLKIYLDHLVSDDCSRDLQYYPKRSFSIGLAEFVESAPKPLEISSGEIAWMLLVTRRGQTH